MEDLFQLYGRHVTQKKSNSLCQGFWNHFAMLIEILHYRSSINYQMSFNTSSEASFGSSRKKKVSTPALPIS